MNTTPSGRNADQLIERARIAYLKVGGREAPTGASNAHAFCAPTHATNLSVDDLFVAAFAVVRAPHSNEYQCGVYVALAYRIEGAPIARPFPPGTAQNDAYHAGLQEGFAIWRKAQEAGAA